MESTRINRRKTKKGTVISNKMDKTVIVSVESVKRHPRYEKVITVRQKFYAHNEGRPLQVGDVVEIQETRPLSKLKRWRVVG
jgi:small subunit ribosomal protein S17